jgi:RimJ/RimL family protein N-acetyltransferase
LTKSLTGEISLRPLKRCHEENVCKWMTSAYILHHSFVVPGPKSQPNNFSTKDYALRYFNILLHDKKRLTFAIVFKERHVGNVGLKEMDFFHKTAECFIEIGESQFRGCGIGFNAMNQLLRCAFLNYELSWVTLDCLEFNFPALKVYGALGFTSTGQICWHYDEFGQYWRVIKMSVKKDDWMASRV